MTQALTSRPLSFVGSSREDLRVFPEDVKCDIGYALFEVQKGRKPISAKPLHGFSGSSVLEITAKNEQGTYRAVYTVQFKEMVYVLHCFQKKSKKGIETPKREIDLIWQRLKMAETDHKINNEERR